MFDRKAVKKAVASCGGTLATKGQTVEGVWYEYKATYDDQEDIDLFIEENDICESYTDFDDGTLTHWFNIK